MDRSKSGSLLRTDCLTRRGWIFGVALALLCSAPALHNGFVNDDLLLIVDNPHAHSFDQLWENLTRDFFYAASNQRIGYYRPLLKLAFIAQYQLFGASPVGYHAVSILLFTLTAMAAFVLLTRLRVSAASATISVALYALHSAHADAVSVITSQGDLLATLLVLLGWLAYIRWREHGQRAGAVGAVLAFAAGLGCKETAAILLPFLAIWETARPQPRSETTALPTSQDAPSRQPGWRQRLARVSGLVPLLLVFGGYLALRAALGITPEHAGHDASPLGYLISASAVWVRSLLRGLLSAAWEPILSARRPDATLLDAVRWTAPALLSLLAAGVLIWRSARLRWAVVLLLVPLLPLLPSSLLHSSQDPRQLLVVDRWLFLSALGAALLWTQLLTLLWTRLLWTSTRLALGAAVVTLALLGLLDSRLQFASYASESSRAILLGRTLKARGDLVPFEREHVLAADAFVAEEGRDWKTAIDSYRQLIVLAPSNYNHHFNLARALYLRGQYVAATRHGWIAFHGTDPDTGRRLARNDSLARGRAARAYLLSLLAEKLQRADLAAKYRRHALELNPSLANAAK